MDTAVVARVKDYLIDTNRKQNRKQQIPSL